MQIQSKNISLKSIYKWFVKITTIIAVQGQGTCSIFGTNIDKFYQDESCKIHEIPLPTEGHNNEEK
jgi:hypothetical protein